jgi:hypothetical protein
MEILKSFKSTKQIREFPRPPSSQSQSSFSAAETTRNRNNPFDTICLGWPSERRVSVKQINFMFS